MLYADPEVTRREIPDRKKELRAFMKKKRSALLADQVEESGGRICQQIRNLPLYQKADLILGYFPFGKEADIRAILKETLQSGKQLALPRVEDQGFMDFREVSSFDHLEKSSMGVMEPSKREQIVELSNKNWILVLVPGLAFSVLENRQGIARMGYGGGYYDRWLSRQAYPTLYTCGIAYSFQVDPKVSLLQEKQDQILDLLVTENDVFYNRRYHDDFNAAGYGV